jgi:hypothetical protein
VAVGAATAKLDCAVKLAVRALERPLARAGFGRRRARRYRGAVPTPLPAAAPDVGGPRYRYRRGLLVAMAGWALFVWSTRIGNAWNDHHASFASKAGATLLSLSFVLLALASLVLLWRERRGRPATTSARGLALMRTFAAWTTAVWIVFATLILVHHHPIAFKAVHVTLGLISIGLSAALWRTTVPVGSSEPVATR